MVCLAERAQVRSFVVGGKSGSRNVVSPNPKDGSLKERPVISAVKLARR